MKTLAFWLLLTTAVFAQTKGRVPPVGGAAGGVTRGVGHSHNDYAQAEPFWGAVRAGVYSLEADVYADVPGKLNVAHNRRGIEQDRDLVHLYLEPLGQWQGHPIELLVDIKSNTDKAVAILTDLMRDFKSDRLAAVVITGARPRCVCLDPRLSIEGTVQEMRAKRLPPGCRYVSAKWSTLFHWDGEDEMPPDEYKKLLELVREAHAQNLKLRLWAAPDDEPSWKAQYRAGVDRINTDRPNDFAEWLDEQLEEDSGT